VRLVPAARKLSTIEERRQDKDVEEKITEKKATIPKNSPGFETR
jgi:hypothetical protein